MRATPTRQLFGISTALLVATGATHSLAAQSAAPVAPSIAAVGCIAQLQDTAAAPPTGHEQGAAKGLTLARATVKSSDGRAAGDPPRSAVPGSSPTSSGTGTTDAAATRAAMPVEQAFWLVGAKSAEMMRFVGRRVELTGTVDDRLATNPGTPNVTDAGAAAARRSTTAAPEAPAVAHPSAPSRSISVLSFRLLDEMCS